VSLEASAFACSWVRHFGFVLFVGVESVRCFHCSLGVVYFLWPCVGLYTFHTCLHCLQMIGMTMRCVTWIRFPFKNLWLIPCFFHLWSKVTRIHPIVLTRKQQAKHIVALKSLSTLKSSWSEITNRFSSGNRSKFRLKMIHCSL